MRGERGRMGCERGREECVRCVGRCEVCRKSVTVSSQDGRLKPTAPYLGFSRRKAVKISSTAEEVSAAVSVWDASVSSSLPTAGASGDWVAEVPGQAAPLALTRGAEGFQQEEKVSSHPQDPPAGPGGGGGWQRGGRGAGGGGRCHERAAQPRACPQS